MAAERRIQALILVAQELLIVGLVITRRGSTAQSRSLWDWAVAMIGTGAPLSCGRGWRCPGSRRSVLACRSSARCSPRWRSEPWTQLRYCRRQSRHSYQRPLSFVRHPLYGSYLIGYVGFLAGNLSMRNVVLIAATSLCHYLRAVAEERILLDDPEYRPTRQALAADSFPSPDELSR